MWHYTLLLVLFACVCTAQNVSKPSNGSAINISSKNESTGDIYNICPVVIEFSNEQEHLSDEELKANAADAAMSAFLLSHPNYTLWDYFIFEQQQKQLMFYNLPLSEKIKQLLKYAVFTADTVINIGQMVADAIEWIMNTIRDPLVGIRQIANWFTEFGKNLKLLWGLMLRDPEETVENVGGGFVVHITHHPTDFAAESVLLFGTGFAVIHGLMYGMEAVFGTMSSAAISQVLLSVLMFMHAIDNPVLTITPLITSVVRTAGTVTTGENVTEDALTLTPFAVEPLKSCKIPKKYRPAFSSRDLCLSSPGEVRQLIFGTAKRSAKMTKDESIAAYNHFHDFVCCYLEDQEFEVNAPSMDTKAFEAKLIATPVKMTNCSQLLGNYSAAIVWHTS